MGRQSTGEMQALVFYDEHGVYDLERLSSYEIVLESIAGGGIDANSNGNMACYNTFNEFCVNANACADNVGCAQNIACIS